jgi:cobalt transporter subunit CbtA
MLYRLLATGLISGAAAGVIVTLVHMVMVAPLIFAAEQYEDAGPQSSPAAGQIAAAPKAPGGAVHIHNDGGAHPHEAWQPADGFERSGFTLLANLISGIAYGLLLATALTLYGQSITLIQGLIWGAAGFLSFAFLPALGLPPELPAAAAGELLNRQIWWLATSFVSAGGLAAGALGSGVVLLAAPHVIGAPHSASGKVGLAPPELAAHFVVNSLFASLVLWLVLGATMAYVMGRMDAKQGAGFGAGNAVS